MGSGRDYWAMGAEFLDLAEHASSSEVVTIYRQLALLYERLAEWTERQRDAPGDEYSALD